MKKIVRKTLDNWELVAFVVVALITATMAYAEAQLPDEWTAPDWDQPVHRFIAVEYLEPVYVWTPVDANPPDAGVIAYQSEIGYQPKIRLWTLDADGQVALRYVVDGHSLSAPANCESLAWIGADGAWRYWALDSFEMATPTMWPGAGLIHDDQKPWWREIRESRWGVPEWVPEFTIWEPYFVPADRFYGEEGLKLIREKDGAKAYTCGF